MVASLTPVEQKMVSLYGSEIMAVRASDGKIYAGVKWICNGLGLTENQAKVQVHKINDDPTLRRGGRKIYLPTASGEQEVTCIELDFLPLWLAKINANIIESPQVKQRLISYQLKAKDVLAAAFIAKPQPDSLEDLIILQAQSIKELKNKVSSIEEKAITAHHRIDSLDAIDTIGDPKQRLNAMVRKYAHKEGLTFSKAWKAFVQAFNTAYYTNLKLLMANYLEHTGNGKMTIPEYLSAVNRLDDALRVADKMLNPPE